MKVENLAYQQNNHETLHCIMSFVLYPAYRRAKYLQNRCSWSNKSSKKEIRYSRYILYSSREIETVKPFVA